MADSTDHKTECRIAIGAVAGRAHRLALLVMGVSGVSTAPMPDQGELTIGRSDRCAIVIDDPLLSREHAVLRVGAHHSVIDLGSSNGTRIGDRQLVPNTPEPLAIGEVVSLGSHVLLLQSATADARRRHLWGHGYFEARLEDECARGRETGRPFAVVRLRTSARRTATEVELALSLHLRPLDIIGTYAPGEYELLLLETDAPSAHALVKRMRAELVAALGGAVHLGLACWPGAGRNPEEIVARAAPPANDDSDSSSSRSPTRRPIANGALDRLRPVVERVAAGKIPVLIMGETGVGKDVLASMLHALSPRRLRPFLCLNCAALPEQLLEGELFGYERGAFTGAQKAKPGLLESAEGGTVFLDEVGEIPPSMQAKLLRAVDQSEVMRIGALKPRAIDVRFVSATNRDLEAEVARGVFREDLYYRLNGVTLVVPPLRDRVAEIAPLARMFAGEAARRLGKDVDPRIEPDALALLESYGWPGNVRELRNVVERAVLLSEAGPITLAHLPGEKMGRTLPAFDDRVAHSFPSSSSLRVARGGARAHAPRGALHEEQRARLVEALARCEGNQTHAATLLGISRRALITRIAKYGLARPRSGKRP
ncbi:MAG: hypothetical protein NVSMB47_06360 [Polyangiales bacterium]